MTCIHCVIKPVTMRESAENDSTYTKGVCESRHILLFGVNINLLSLFIQVYFRAALIPNFSDTSSTKYCY